MHLRFFSTVLTLLIFSVISTAQDELKVSFEPTKYPISRNDLLTVKAINSTTQAIEAKIRFELKDPLDKVLYSWLVPSYIVPPGTHILLMDGAPGISSTPDNIHLAKDQDRISIFTTAILSGQYGYSEKTAILRIPTQSFDFNSQYSTSTSTATNSTVIKREVSTPTPPPAPAVITTTTTVPNQVPDYSPPGPPTTPTKGANSFIAVPEKMNIFYLGVENTLKVSGADDFTTVTCNQPGIGIRPSGSEYFIVTVNMPGEYTLSINTEAGESQQVFRAKRIPDPVALLGDKFGGDIGVGQFREQAGVLAMLQHFDFDARCQTTGYIIWRIQTDGTRSSVNNSGPRFSAETQELINLAMPGDIYIFDNIRARCPGDVVQRNIPGMTFFVK